MGKKANLGFFVFFRCKHSGWFYSPPHFSFW
jgi:hypothetical protein